MKYRILCFDGGGLRGIISATILKNIYNALSKKGLTFLERMKPDMISGTSTGGIIALCLAEGLDISYVIDLYMKRGASIFRDTVMDDIKDMGNLIGADYSISGLKKELSYTFEDRKLRDLKCKVVIPTFDLDNGEPNPDARTWKPKIFHNFGTDESNPDRSKDVHKVAIYTSAAPTYFPSCEGYIDGGVYANNPSMIAIAKAISTSRMGNACTLSDISLLSIGTGKLNGFIPGDVDWGITQWAKPLLNIMFEGVSDISHYQATQLLGARYHRVQIPLDKNYPLDSVKHVHEFQRIGNEYDISGTAEWIKNFWF